MAGILIGEAWLTPTLILHQQSIAEPVSSIADVAVRIGDLFDDAVRAAFIDGLQPGGCVAHMWLSLYRGNEASARLMKKEEAQKELMETVRQVIARGVGWPTDLLTLPPDGKKGGRKRG